MPENISTYWARNVKLKSRQGDKFDFVLNIKNEDGSDYVFAENTEAFFGVYKRTANPEGNLLTDDSGLIVAFDTSVENGKISVFNDDMGGYLASKGTYHYVLFTYDPDNYSLNLQELIADFNDLTNSPINHLRVGWMGEDDSVLPSLGQPLEEWQFYHEYYHLGGADDLEWNTDMAEALDLEGAPGGSIASPLTPPYISYCIVPEWCRIKANLEDGPNVYFPSVSPSYLSLWPYIGQDLIDNDNVWNGDSITYQNGMTEIFIRVDIQVHNVVRCDFEGDPEFTDYYIIEQKGLQTYHVGEANIDFTPFALPFNVGLSKGLIPALGNLPKAVNITNTGYDIIYPNEGISWIDENGDEQTGPYWTPPIQIDMVQVSKLFAPTNSTPSGDYQNHAAQMTHPYPPDANGMRELYDVTNPEEYLTLYGYNILSEDDKNAILLNNQNGGWNENFLRAPNETPASLLPQFRDPYIYDDIIWDGVIPPNHSDDIYSLTGSTIGQNSILRTAGRAGRINGPLYGWGNDNSLEVQQYDEENGPHAFSTWAVLEFLSTLPDPPTDYINFLQSEVNGGARLAFGLEFTEATENRGIVRQRFSVNTVNMMSYDSMSIDDTSGKVHLKVWIEDELGNVLGEYTQTSGNDTEIGYFSIVGTHGGNYNTSQTANGGLTWVMTSGIWADIWSEVYTNNPNQSWKLFCRLGNLKTCVDPQNIAFETYDGNADLVDFGDDNIIFENNNMQMEPLNFGSNPLSGVTGGPGTLSLNNEGVLIYNPIEEGEIASNIGPITLSFQLQITSHTCYSNGDGEWIWGFYNWPYSNPVPNTFVKKRKFVIFAVDIETGDETAIKVFDYEFVPLITSPWGPAITESPGSQYATTMPPVEVTFDLPENLILEQFRLEIREDTGLFGSLLNDDHNGQIPINGQYYDSSYENDTTNITSYYYHNTEFGNLDPTLIYNNGEQVSLSELPEVAVVDGSWTAIDPPYDYTNGFYPISISFQLRLLSFQAESYTVTNYNNLLMENIPIDPAVISGEIQPNSINPDYNGYAPSIYSNIWTSQFIDSHPLTGVMGQINNPNYDNHLGNTIFDADSYVQYQGSDPSQAYSAIQFHMGPMGYASYDMLVGRKEVVDNTYYPDLTELKFNFRFVHAATGSILARWEKTHTISQDNYTVSEDPYKGTTYSSLTDSITFASNASTNTMDKNIRTTQMIDGDEYYIEMKPETYRKYDNDEDGWIRVAGTYIYSVWENNSYISTDNPVGVETKYWLYGDFVVSRNNPL